MAAQTNAAGRCTPASGPRVGTVPQPKLLSWLSLIWMSGEGVLGLIAVSAPAPSR